MAHEHPELSGYIPLGEYRERRRRARRVARVVVMLAVAALILPGAISTWMLAVRTAAAECRAEVAHHTVGASGSATSFEVLGRVGPGWYCYSTDTSGFRTLVAPMGLIPGG